MTIKLFYQNQNLISFTSRVEEVLHKNDEYHIVLKKTVFYPEGGGQPSDIGFIEGVKVEKVYEIDNKIYHITKLPIDKESVQGFIDFERRFDFMQQHSGEHLLAAAFYKLYNGHNIGFHLGEDYITIDITLPDVNNQMINSVEYYVNSLIYKNIPIKTYMVDDSKLNTIPLRKNTNIKGNIRIVEIEGIDYSACCGTHLDTTGQIGVIKILRAEKYKGNTRIYFKCGKRATDDYSKKHDIVDQLSKLLSAEEAEIYERIRNQCNLVKEQQKSIIELKERIMENEVKDIIIHLQGEKFIMIYNDKSFEDISNIANILNKKQIIALLCATSEKRFILSYPKSSELDCSSLVKEIIKQYGGKGGGNKNRVQGSFSNTEELLEFFNHIKTLI